MSAPNLSDACGVHKGGKVEVAGCGLGEARFCVICIHGRGATTDSMLAAKRMVAGTTYPRQWAVVAPTANEKQWYPKTAFGPIQDNEPFLSSSLAVVSEVVAWVLRSSIPASNVVMIGFSQGACLLSEWLSRTNGQHTLGAVGLFCGARIGDPPQPVSLNLGGLAGTRIALACGTTDQWVNVTRVVQTAQYLSELGANVTLQLVPGLPHQIHEGSRKLVECWMAELDSDSACLVAVTENGVDESAEHYANFVYTEQIPVRVVFKDRALGAVPTELQRLGRKRALIICAPSQRSRQLATTLSQSLLKEASIAAELCPNAQQHVPDSIVAQTLAQNAVFNADVLVAFGGGSATGLAKAVALATRLPIVAIPTTFSGSEMTSIYGISSDSSESGGGKRTGRDPLARPVLVLYDCHLLVNLPEKVGLPSAFNALAHCVEALYAADADPVTLQIAERGVHALVSGLRKWKRMIAATDAYNAQQRLHATRVLLFGSFLAGLALQRCSMALQHKTCHVLGGQFHLPHSETHTALLPHVLRFNEMHAPRCLSVMSSALRSPDPSAAVAQLARECGCVMSLSDLGLRREDVPLAAQLVVRGAGGYANPRKLDDEAAVLLMLQRAFDGAQMP